MDKYHIIFCINSGCCVKKMNSFHVIILHSTTDEFLIINPISEFTSERLVKGNFGVSAVT